jgi:hypothetical protein
MTLGVRDLVENCVTTVMLYLPYQIEENIYIHNSFHQQMHPLLNI